MPVIEENDYTRAEALLPELTRRYKKGDSTNALAKEYGIRREALATVLTVAGVAPSTPGRDKLLAYVRQNKGLSVDDLAKAMDMPKSTISRYLRGTEEQQYVILRKGTNYTVYPDKQKIAALKEAWKQLDKTQKAKGLSRVRYDKLVGHRKDRPSSTTFIRRYGSWSAACEAAGISAAASRRASYPQEFSDEDILRGINEFTKATGQTSFHAYSKWARQNNRASGPLIVIRMSSWSEARSRAIQLAEKRQRSRG